MTYNELLQKLNQLSPEQKEMDVTVYSYTDDEYRPVKQLDIVSNTGVLDDEHPVLSIN